MEIIAKYIHGSEDSLDTDIYYVIKELPTFYECRKFCSENKDENRNLIVIENGIVTDCFIGTNDEINNALLDTYALHEQEYPLIITQRVTRDIPLKAIRATRGILSLLSRSQYRSEIKQALKSNWTIRLQTLSNIDFTKIDFTKLEKQGSPESIKKVIAFQIGQTLGLLEGEEFYTKSSIANNYPRLLPYLYRRIDSNVGNLQEAKDLLVKKLMGFQTEEGEINEKELIHIVNFLDYNVCYELKHETKIEK